MVPYVVPLSFGFTRFQKVSSYHFYHFDLDPNLEKAWTREQKSSMVTDAIQKGLPKTKFMRIPFRMEMSGFATIPGSVPIVGNIGGIWPILPTKVADALCVKLDFMSYKQSLPAGEKIREWIVKCMNPVDRERMFAAARDLLPVSPSEKSPLSDHSSDTSSCFRHKLDRINRI